MVSAFLVVQNAACLVVSGVFIAMHHALINPPYPLHSTLKAKLAKLRSELFLESSSGGGGGAGEGFSVARNGDARVALIGFPSVGKSSLLAKLTETESLAANYEFTTLTWYVTTVERKYSVDWLLDQTKNR